MKKLILGLGFSLLTTSALADTSIWKISKGKESLYLGGTIHLLASSDLPLPGEYETAYKDAEKLVFEVDQGKLSTPEFQMTMMRKMMYQDDTTLDKVLSKKTYQRLAEFCTSRGMDIQQFNKFRPSFIAMTISLIEMQRLGMTGDGVDKLYYDKALKDKKPQQPLETVEQQLNYLANIGAGYDDEMIINSLNEIEQLKEMMAKLKKAWRDGDIKALEKVGIEPMMEFPGVYQSLLVERNNNWMPQIEAMLHTPEKEFILVGALHLAGKDGVLHQLKAKGYKVEKL